MANQVAARLTGDDYQHLHAWFFALELKMPRRQVRQVIVEDSAAGSVDDVTILHEVGSQRPDLFYQIKYHVDQRGAYSTDTLIRHEPGHSSLLQKFWRAWHMLATDTPGRQIELHLLSNWSWDSTDAVRQSIAGRDNRLQESFFTATERQDIGKLRAKWVAHLGVPDEGFRAFVSTLRFDLGFHCFDEFEKRISERMEYLGLRHDETALLLASGVIRDWISNGRHEMSHADLENALAQHELYRPTAEERCVTVYLSTIKSQKFEIDPDHVIDWREYFAGDSQTKGHQLLNPAQWNGAPLPELRRLERQIGEETSCRLVKARGLARLSAWFAFGFTFSEVGRYTIEVDQNGSLWRTDAASVDDFELLADAESGEPKGEMFDSTSSTVAVGISVTGDLDNDVRAYLRNAPEKVAALLLLRPNRPLGRECLKSAPEVVAFADQAKTLIRQFVKRSNATRLLLFYFGPLSGACFLGHRLNAVCREIQIMEDQQPGYAPSFVLA